MKKGPEIELNKAKNINQLFANYLKYLLSKTGWSKDEACIQLDVRAPTLNSWMKGEVGHIREKNVEALRRKLGANPATIKAILAGVKIPISNCEEFSFFSKHVPPHPRMEIEANWKSYYQAAPLLEVRDTAGHVLLHDIPCAVAFDNIDRDGPIYHVDQVIISQEDDCSAFVLDEDTQQATRGILREYLDKADMLLPEERRPKDGTALRLRDILEQDGRLVLRVQDVHYHSYVRTNLLAEHKADGRQATIREVLFPGGLEDLPTSRCGNVLGINVLVVTRDGYLVLQQRSHKVLTFPCRLGPSASGTLTPRQRLGRTSVVDMMVGGELGEELALAAGDFARDQVHFLGIGRDLFRNGNPDMFFFARTSRPWDEVQKGWRERADDRAETEALVPIRADVLLGEEVDEEKVRGWARGTWDDKLWGASPAALANFAWTVRWAMVGARRHRWERGRV